MRESILVSSLVVLMAASSVTDASAQPERPVLTPLQAALLCGPVTDAQPPAELCGQHYGAAAADLAGQCFHDVAE